MTEKSRTMMNGALPVSRDFRLLAGHITEQDL